jgi:hypothetical protein
VSLILLLAGALFAALFLLNNLAKTVVYRPKLSFLDAQLGVLALLAPVAAVIANHLGAAPDANIDFWALLLGGATAGISLIILLLELLRPQRFKGARGLLGLGAGIVIAAASLLIPFVAAYLALQREPPPAPTATTVVQAETTAEITVEPTPINRAAEIFYAIRSVIKSEIDVEDRIITDALENGTPLADIVLEHGGDLERVIDGVTTEMLRITRDAQAAGELHPLQAALLLSQMETLIRIAVYSDINLFVDRFGGRPTAEPGATRSSVFVIITASPTAAAESTDAPPVPVTAAPVVPARTATPQPSAGG